MRRVQRAHGVQRAQNDRVGETRVALSRGSADEECTGTRNESTYSRIQQRLWFDHHHSRVIAAMRRSLIRRVSDARRRRGRRADGRGRRECAAAKLSRPARARRARRFESRVREWTRRRRHRGSGWKRRERVDAERVPVRARVVRAAGSGGDDVDGASRARLRRRPRAD